MIGDFLASWPLFHTSYLAGWLIAVVLALVGVWVVARDQIFLGVAVAHASTLGVALALWVGGLGVAASSDFLRSEGFAAVLAVGGSVLTALLTAREKRPGAESPEVVTGWVFLVSASLPVLMLANSPHGLEEIHRLMFSTLLGAVRVDLWIFVGLGLATVAVVARFRSQLLLFALDPEMAAAVGMGRRRWNLAVALWLGVAVGLSIRVSGTLFTFGCLVLPALIAKNLSREVGPLLVLAPLISLTAAVLGFVLAHGFDMPPAHVTVALLCATLALAWVVGRLRARAGA